MRRSLLSLFAAGATLTTLLPVGQGIAAEGAEGLHKLNRTGPRPLPDFAFTDAGGVERRMADFAGRPVLINLWATWCAPCVAEMPALDRTQAALAEEGWAVLALSSDRGGAKQVEPFYARTRIEHLGLWLDPGGAAGRSLGARGLPTSIIVDRKGQELARVEGAAEWDHPEWLKALRGLVGEA
ncbi:TlpA family protein disulfide reductase [Pseudoroseomonas globiformis]|uniref:TlpA family protein disulfide reductase n=1 Tax=Teichococcus globiformis TaxID=2307229 RepID=A0ABV7FZ09_9PROT